MTVAPRAKAGWAVVVAVAGLTGTTASGCGESDTSASGCTLIGCDSGISFDTEAFPVPDGGEVRACVDDVCEELPRQGGLVKVPQYNDRNGDFDSAMVTVTSAGTVLLRAETKGVTATVSTPNGRGCPPTCRHAALILDSEGKLQAPSG